MLKKAITLLSAIIIAVGAGFRFGSLRAGKTYYWISHGSPADPVWTYFLAGAKLRADDTGNKVNTSFHNGDVPAQQEAVRAAISAGATGIVTTSPDPGSLVQVVKEANAANIPIINFIRPIRRRASTPMSAVTTRPSAGTGRNISSTRSW